MTDSPSNGRVFSSSVVAAGNASAFGGACAVMIIFIYHMKGIDFPAGAEASIGIIVSTVCIYVRALLSKFTGVDLP